MKFRPKITKAKKPKLYRALLTAAFLSNGILLSTIPAIAQTPLTAPGTTIDNQATATYEDPNNPPDPNNPNDPRRINTTSNKVTVTVAEVAGILVQAGTVNDLTPNGTVQVGDILEYNFTITNIGNDPTKFRIPGTVTVSGNGTLVNGSLEYFDAGTWKAVPNGGVITDNSVPVNGTVPVRVRVTVNSNAVAGDNISVTLGQTTPPNQASNVPRVGGEINDNLDVYTTDNPDGTQGEVPGIPANGVVEGSASASITVQPKFYSLATILKTRAGYSNNNTPTDISDDTINYNLSLRVSSTDNTGQNIAPSALAGTDVPGLPGKNILVSDAIPFGTELAAIPTAPTGWTVVYSTTPLTLNTSANAATWTTTAPPLSQVTRIGFVKATVDGNTSTYLAAADAQLTSFSIQLKVKTGQTAPLTIANIAQVFGKTPETNAPVLDESGDENPSNFDGPPGNMTPPQNTDTNGDGVPDQLPPTVPNGYLDDPKTNPAVLNNTGTDTNNNNTGQGPGGEANVFTLNIAALLNGPNGQPNAVGPTNNNDDFTNKSSNVPPNTAPGSTFDPNAVTFNNTISNSGTQADNISLLPTPPANAANLPNGTVVTISANNDATTATYTYNGTQFTFTSGTGIVGGNPVSAINPVRIDNVAVGGTANYTVTVDLPAGTPLSTDPGFERGFPVPITAFIDTNGNGLADDAATNITIDRVYTGFLQLLKQSRILQGTGPAVQGTDGTLSTTPKTPAPGNIIEYVIEYKNISEPQPGSGVNNVILNAGKVVITEDGTVLPNNWAIDNAPSNGVIDTSHVPNSAQDIGGTITFFSGASANVPATNSTSGTTQDQDVTKYINTLTNPVTPGQTGTFTFQRKVN